MALYSCGGLILSGRKPLMVSIQWHERLFKVVNVLSDVFDNNGKKVSVEQVLDLLLLMSGLE